jgi:tRNA pseudouridine55 synthase
VTISRFELVSRDGDDLTVHVECSTGTYVRALARDLGAALGVGGHLTVLRRTRVGGFGLDEAHDLDSLARELAVLPLEAAAARAFPRVDVDDSSAARIRFGQRLVLDVPADPSAVFAPDGSLVALVNDRDGVAQPICVFAGSAQ